MLHRIRLAMQTGTKVIHISEKDTQITASPKPPTQFLNTWSVEGLYEEAIAPAEMGWGTGGVLNAISKQGTNSFRGSAFFFDQESEFTKKDFFTEQFGLEMPDETKQRQWGGSLGGPASFCATAPIVVSP